MNSADDIKDRDCEDMVDDERDSDSQDEFKDGADERDWMKFMVASDELHLKRFSKRVLKKEKKLGRLLTMKELERQIEIQAEIEVQVGDDVYYFILFIYLIN